MDSIQDQAQIYIFLRWFGVLWTCSCNFLGPKTHCGAYCSDIVFFYKADTPKGPYISFNQKNECLWLFPDVSTELPREHYLLMSAQLYRMLGNFLAIMSLPSSLIFLFRNKLMTYQRIRLWFNTQVVNTYLFVLIVCVAKKKSGREIADINKINKV